MSSFFVSMIGRPRSEPIMSESRADMRLSDRREVRSTDRRSRSGVVSSQSRSTHSQYRSEHLINGEMGDEQPSLVVNGRGMSGDATQSKPEAAMNPYLMGSIVCEHDVKDVTQYSKIIC